MRIRFTPERKVFFELFSRASSNAVDIARLAGELFERYPESGQELLGQIKELEHTGDTLTYEIVDQINKSFVTPFDRDDIYRLAGAVDDVTDAIEDATELLGLYDVEQPTRSSTRPSTVSGRGASRRCRPTSAHWPG